MKTQKPHPKAKWNEEIQNWQLPGGSVWLPNFGFFGTKTETSISIILNPDQKIQVIQDN